MLAHPPALTTLEVISMSIYYVYKLLNPLKDNQVFYVGKGHGNRAEYHFKAINRKSYKSDNLHKTRTLKQIAESGLTPNIDIIPCKSEQDAFDMERQLISKYGRQTDGGILTNLCLGGEGHSHGHIKVHQYNVFREFIAEHPSIQAASLNVTGGYNAKSAIGQACKRDTRSRTPLGFVWCYATDVPDWNWVFHKIKPVYQWDQNGNLVGRFKTLSEMFSVTRIDSGSVKKFITDTNPKSYPGNHQWSHEPVFPAKTLMSFKRLRPVLCLETSQIFESCAAAERFMKGTNNKCNIGSCANGWVKSAYGFTWKFVDDI